MLGDDKDLDLQIPGMSIAREPGSDTRWYRQAMTARAVVAGSFVALALAVPVGATTGIEVTVPVTVSLTDKGVSFSKKVDATTDTTLQVKVVNRSSARRWFELGWRKTHLLRRGGVEYFYYSFHVPGRVAWHSTARGGKAYRGSLRVRLPIGFG